MVPEKFQKLIRRWYRRYGRHTLPWRRASSGQAAAHPYRILVSEVMLQQTRVSRVLRVYPRFIRRFPSLEALARAPLRAVLLAWQGMGYNRRAVYLKRLAEIVVREHGGKIPRDPALFRRLPGIGPGTAGAVAAFAYGRRVAFLETNIRRVYLHFFFHGRRRVGDPEVLERISSTMPSRSVREWYYALMDYGALALYPSKGIANPNRRSAHYSRQPPFSGSRRQARGRILEAVLRKRSLAPRELAAELGRELHLRRYTGALELSSILEQLIREGLIALNGHRIIAPPPVTGPRQPFLTIFSYYVV